jgi:Flp pilus assembly protein TadD
VALALVGPAIAVLALVALRERALPPVLLGGAIAALAAIAGVATHWWMRRQSPRQLDIVGLSIFERTGVLVAILAGLFATRLVKPTISGLGFDEARQVQLQGAIAGQRPWLVAIAIASVLLLVLEVADRRAPAWRLDVHEAVSTGALARWSAIVVAAWMLIARFVASEPDVYRFETAAQRVKGLPVLAKQAAARPRDARALHEYALALTDAKRFAEATPVAERAVALEPRWSDGRNLAGWTLAMQQRWLEALPHLRVATAESHSNGTAWHNYVWVLGQTGKFGEGAAACPTALRLNPDEPWVAFHCARHYWYSARKREEAFDLARRAAQGQPGEPAPRVLLGIMYRRRLVLDASRAQLDSARLFAPRAPFVLVELGLTAALQHDARTVIEAFSIADTVTQGAILRDPALRRFYDQARAGRLPEVIPDDVRAPGSAPAEAP